jgi:hypothetical protein
MIVKKKKSQILSSKEGWWEWLMINEMKLMINEMKEIKGCIDEH